MAAACVKGLGFLLFVWLARVLSVEEYAKFGILYGAQTGVAAFAQAGILECAIGQLQRYQSARARSELFGALIGIFLLCGTLSAGVVVCGYSLATQVFSLRELYLFALAAGVGLLTAFGALEAGFLRLEERHEAALAWSSFFPAMTYVGGALVCLAAPSAGAFFAGGLGGVLLGFGIALRRGMGWFGVRRPATVVDHWPQLVAPYLVVAIVGWLSGYGANGLIRALTSTEEVARYTFLFTLASIPQLLATSMNQVWSPRFYRIIHELPPIEVERRNRRFFLWQGLALGVCGTCLLLAYVFGLEFVGGHVNAYKGLGYGLTLLAGSYIVSIPWWHAQNYFFVHSQGRLLMRITIHAGVVGFALWAALIVWYGSAGLYLGFAVQVAIRSLWIWVVAHRRWGIRFPWQGILAGSAGLLSTCALLTWWRG